ncbi:uncharacterized protein EI90DRAFT_3137669 [Cantharellus anzutake]|uniref:uncharacterized protein n=1 Tax=Cantharellus anzutake TaxID=1750568 RepID=UPI0019081989|nr:uncharacterized protein EI90DRAFT_3137669 [Cantharellus anzutake]KAF8312147.1 hypothetical protein EI90DRAFT_3137669 [Cantharellus anzutake]
MTVIFVHVNVKNISITSESVPMSAFAPEDDPFKNIYDAKPLGSYNFQQDKNMPHPLDLKPGDIVVTQCLLEKFTETGTILNHAAFKLIGVAWQQSYTQQQHCNPHCISFKMGSL